VSELPEDVARFIAGNISSVSQLEVLLLLRNSGAKTWSRQEIGGALYTSPEMMAAPLAELCDCGLLSATPPPDELYRFNPATPGLEAVVAKLNDLYAQRRVAVIGLIYSQPSDRVRSFADAFKFRKDKDQG
jgi:hypothetical protein